MVCTDSLVVQCLGEPKVNLWDHKGIKIAPKRLKVAYSTTQIYLAGASMHYDWAGSQPNLNSTYPAGPPRASCPEERPRRMSELTRLASEGNTLPRPHMSAGVAWPGAAAAASCFHLVFHCKAAVCGMQFPVKRHQRWPKQVLEECKLGIWGEKKCSRVAKTKGRFAYARRPYSHLVFTEAKAV